MAFSHDVYFPLGQSSCCGADLVAAGILLDVDVPGVVQIDAICADCSSSIAVTVDVFDEEDPAVAVVEWLHADDGAICEACGSSYAGAVSTAVEPVVLEAF